MPETDRLKELNNRKPLAISNHQSAPQAKAVFVWLRHIRLDKSRKQIEDRH
jgi:hypothetical protein